MLSIGSRRVVVAVLLATTVVLAGCSGGGTTTPTDAMDGEPTATDGGVEAEGNVTAAVSPLDYRWQEGESYTYESVIEGSSSRYTWTVAGVIDGQVTAEIVADYGNATRISTITGPQGNLLGEADSETTIFTALQAFRRIATGHRLETGNSWTISSGDYDIGGNRTQVEVTVAGTTTVQGVQCYDLEMTFGNRTFSGCVNEDWPFALSASFSQRTATDGETRTIQVQYTLVEFDRP